MKKYFITIFIVILFIIDSCSIADKFPSENKEFVNQLDSYLKYIDSNSFYKKDRDYISIVSQFSNDTTFFVFYISDGAYQFIEEKNEFIDFIRYKDYDFLLLGNFPNQIVNNQRNENKNLPLEIVKERYPKEYKEYLINPKRVYPYIIDLKEIELWFYKDKLIYKK